MSQSALPRTVGAYRILELLGQGGMGIVYAAEHRETGGRAAVKTVRVPHQGLVASLRREIHALARIRHPGIVRILDEGMQDGLPWYAMERLEGRTLRQFAQTPSHSPGQALGRPTIATLEHAAGARTLVTAGTAVNPGEPELTGQTAVHEGRPEPTRSDGATLQLGTPATRLPGGGERLVEVLRVVRQLCAPLAFLHGEGLVHRDLKPENILVQPDGRPVLVDFGLMAQFSGELSREELELAGAGAGTIAYMAPEQLLGELVDARADLYALGCILYELVTGRGPYPGATAEDLRYGHLEVQPRRPSEIAAGIPPQLDALVLRLLAKQPRERLGHASDVAAALALLGAGEEDPGGPLPRAYLYRPGLAGRSETLRSLWQGLSGLASRGGGVLLIGGESGVGKTRLVLELAREARGRRMVVLSGHAVAQGGGPLQALRQPLQALADRCRERGVPESERIFGRHGKILAVYEPSLGDLPGQDLHPEPAPLPHDAARLRLYGALTETFKASATDVRSLLILDDLQWADELTLGWLEFLLQAGPAEARPQRALLVLGTYRSEEAGAGTAIQPLLESPGVQLLPLGRLAEASVGSMVGDMLALAPPPAIFVRYLSRHSEGNPFFVAEYLRTAVAEKLLYRDGAGKWQVAEPAGGQPETHAMATEAVYEALPLPGSLRELVGRRLAGLSASARDFVEIASVLGREADEPLLLEVAKMHAAQGLEAAQESIARQVLEEIPGNRLRFVHDQLREVAYEGIAMDRRRQLHRAAAENLESRGGREALALAVELAALGHHWEQAVELARARDCYLASARKAATQYAQAEAERLYRAHLRLVEQPTSESILVRNEFAQEILSIRMRNDEALSEHHRALEDSRGIGDKRGEGTSLLGLANASWRLGRPDDAKAFCEQALEIVIRCGPPEAEGDILRLLALLRYEKSQFPEATALYQRALEVQRSVGNRQGEGRTLLNLGLIHRDQSRMNEARSLYEQALETFIETADRRWEGMTLNAFALSYFDQGQAEKAQPLFERAIGIAREIGELRLEAVIRLNLGLVRQTLGHMDEARDLLEETLAIYRRIGDRRFEGQVLGSLANLHHEQGRDDQAETLMKEAIARHRLLADRRSEGVDLTNLAAVHRAQGRIEESVDLYGLALGIHREMGNRQGEGHVLTGLGQIRRLQGRPDEGAALCRQALALLHEVGDCVGEGVTLQEMSVLERWAGDLSQSKTFLQEAGRLLGETGSPILLGQCLCEEGHLLLAEGRPGRDCLDRAEQLARGAKVGAASDLGQAIDRLRRAVVAFEAGLELVRGECSEDLPRADSESRLDPE